MNNIWTLYLIILIKSRIIITVSMYKWDNADQMQIKATYLIKN